MSETRARVKITTRKRRDPVGRKGVSSFLAWGDFHARSRFACSTIPEDKWGTTRSLGFLGNKQLYPGPYEVVALGRAWLNGRRNVTKRIFFQCYSRLTVEILHGIIFIIDGKISFLCLCHRFSLPVRLRLTKQTNKLTILASLNHSCRAFHLMGQYFLAPSIVLHRTWAWASDSLSGNGSLLKKLSEESNLLLKSLMASLSLFLPVTFLAISFA